MIKTRILMVLMLGCLLITGVVNGENLLPNPGFEEVAEDSTTMPLMWKISIKPGGEGEWSTNVVRSGERSVMIGAVVGEEKWSLWYVFTPSSPATLIPGKTYRLSGYFKTQGIAEEERVNARVIWRDQNAKTWERQTFAIPLVDGMSVELIEKGSFGEEWNIELGKVQVDKDTGWTYFSVDMVASTLQALLQGDHVRYYVQVIIGRLVPIGTESLDGTVWFDDISFSLVE